MFYHISSYVTQYYSFFNVFHYVSFRSVGALLGSLMLTLFLFPWFIRKSQQFFRSKVREHTPVRHQIKNDTPTMGGLLMIAITLLMALFWVDLTRPIVWIFLLCLTLFGLLGAWDDWLKINKKKGVSARFKFSMQIFAALLVVIPWYFCCSDGVVCIPLFKFYEPYLGLFMIPWGVFIVVATSNAVNLTDGLDGLAISSLIPNFAFFSLLAYVAGHVGFAQYLHIPFVMSAEVSILGAALIGSSLGFLWYNTYPAEIFMGDVGSLSLGAGLGLLALITGQELLLPLSGGLFVIEAISVILQVGLYKLRGRRIFKMAPLHHHFELLGWQESKITIRFGIISLVMCLLALLIIKIR
ncbi:MAG TPA: phospho-N-acetylmuramoyl-pentapeptide-transferase [Candidatus Babeliales bacterium]|nr:phospho-N-acetylmuramoyl-pentapeptide-transferase [Candidatus Babeliales bacterium]